jgi:lactoylglutathione lyase
MAKRAFPLVFARRVATTAAFYERLGFARQVQNPPTGEPTYVGLRRGSAELGIVSVSWPEDQYGAAPGDTNAGFEMFVFVDDVDGTVQQLHSAGTPVLREPVDMPWGERVAHVADPDGNPVALAATVRQPSAGTATR